MTPITHEVPTAKGLVHVDEHPGAGPAIVLMHGIPDDSRIYDRLLPELDGRHVVTFDFHGHGRSGRDEAWPLEPGRHERELAAVIEALGLERPILVGHDISGPVAIGHTLSDPDRVGGLVLLNTFFGSTSTLELPEFIRLLADPHLAPLADAIVADPNIMGWMLLFTNSKLNPEATGAEGVAELAILPQFFGSAEQPDALAAIRAWTADLLPGLAEQDAQVASGALARLEIPVRIAFGENDPYFDAGVGEHLHGVLPGSVLGPIRDAAHWPQWDQPAATAAAIAEVAG
jgi:2-hydroxy-6-oxonona-2,4-dienedioate hydrolase